MDLVTAHSMPVIHWSGRAADHALVTVARLLQDTISICAPVATQLVALGALDAGTPWVKEQVQLLAPSYASVRTALAASLGEEAIRGGTGVLHEAHSACLCPTVLVWYQTMLFVTQNHIMLG